MSDSMGTETAAELHDDDMVLCNVIDYLFERLAAVRSAQPVGDEPKP